MSQSFFGHAIAKDPAKRDQKNNPEILRFLCAYYVHMTGSSKLYAIRHESGLVKLGKAQNPEHRLGSLRNSCPCCSYELIDTHTPEHDTSELEVEIHNMLDGARRRGEWFEIEDVDLHSLALTATRRIKHERSEKKKEDQRLLKSRLQKGGAKQILEYLQEYEDTWHFCKHKHIINEVGSERDASIGVRYLEMEDLVVGDTGGDRRLEYTVRLTDRGRNLDLDELFD